MQTKYLPLTVLAWLLPLTASANEPLVDPEDRPTINVWPNQPPGEPRKLPPEADQTKADGRLVAGKRVIRLGNVSTPQITLYQPSDHLANGSAVIVCPGGGHYILAYDLEGTEIAAWLNSMGITAIVLKYRVPFRDENQKWIEAVQDAQRSMSLVRSRAKEWNIDPNRIGMCGFSAGGATAALTSLLGSDRQYDPIDAVDMVSSVPDFTMLIYPGGLAEKEAPKLRNHVIVKENVPPMFFVHAFDDDASVQNSLLLASKLREKENSAELHIYESGGHGYGLRRTDAPVTAWPIQAEQWLAKLKLLK